MRSRFVFVLATCSLALALAACGNKGNSSAPVAASTKAPVAVQPTQATAAPTIAPQAPGGNSDGSLAAGFNLIAPAPDADHADAVGIAPSIALNATEDPMVAYLAKNLNGEDYTLYFAQWDRSSKSWTKPVSIDVVSDTFHFTPQLKLARDASNNLIGVAYRQAESVNRLALSTDNGATWQVEEVKPSTDGGIDNPSLALANGKTYVAFTVGANLIVFSRSGSSGAFTESTAPSLPNTADVNRIEPGLAIDSAGRPGVAYMLAPTDGYTTTVAFWRPDEAQAYVVTDSNGNQNDSPNISLAFDGTKPRVAINLLRSNDDFNNGTMYVITSDDGQTWTAPVHIQQDGGASMNSILSIVTNPQGGAAIVAPGTGGSGGDTCGQPKLARSTDLKTWTTCSPDANQSLQLGAEYGSGVFDSHGALYIAFLNSSTFAKVPPGLYVWRGQ